jgi:hypothetical protein
LNIINFLFCYIINTNNYYYNRWVNLDGRTPPVALILSKVAFTTNPTKTLLAGGEPVVVAQVLATPTVEENLEIIYTTASNQLVINKKGWLGLSPTER